MEYRSINHTSKTTEQRELELEAKVKLPKRQKARVEYLPELADKKVVTFDVLVDLAEKEYDIEIRKNCTQSYRTLYSNLQRNISFYLKFTLVLWASLLQRNKI